MNEILKKIASLLNLENEDEKEFWDALEKRNKKGRILDSFIDEENEIIAVLFDHHSWSGSSGVQWDREVLVKKKGYKPGSLYYMAVRDGGSHYYDTPGYLYTNIVSVSLVGTKTKEYRISLGIQEGGKIVFDKYSDTRHVIEGTTTLFSYHLRWQTGRELFL